VQGACFGTSDPDYRTIADRGRQGEVDEMKRFDMPGFQPRVDWVREMRRYGILPLDAPDGQPVDVYATERRYWESLWHQPETRER
jgi:hypothetical protein